MDRRRFLRGVRNAVPAAVLGRAILPPAAAQAAPLADPLTRAQAMAATSRGAAILAGVGGPGIFVGDHGAVGDGITDDTAAVQAALTDAATQGVPLVFGHGVYRVEGLGAANVEQVTVLGQGEKSSVLKLRDDNGQGGLGQILRVTDVGAFTFRDIGVHGNFANAKPSVQLQPLINFVTTAATVGRDNFAVVVENVEFIESAKGFGHFRAGVFENGAPAPSRFSHVIVRNVRSYQHGTFGAAVTVHGPAELILIEDVSTRNDGQFGLECYGPTTYPGARGIAVTISSDHDFVHQTRHVIVQGLSCFRDNGGLFVQKVKRLDASAVTITEDCTNPFYDTPPTGFTVDPATDVVSATVPAGKYGNNSIVRLSTTGSLPAPLVAGRLYYVRDRSGNTFRLASTHTGAAINLTTTGAGSHSLEFLGYTYTSSLKGDDNTHTVDDPVRHRYTNASVIRSSPHTGNRNFSYEETATGTSGLVQIEDCNFNRPVSITAQFSGLQPSIKGCTFDAGWMTNADFGTGSLLAMVCGLVESCVFNGPVTLTQVSDLSIRGCRFSVPLRHFMKAGASGILRLHDNVFNTADKAPGQLSLSPPSSGGKLLIEMRGNRIPQGATKTTTLTYTSPSKVGLTVSATDNDM